MPSFIDLSGKRFSRLLALRRAENDGNGGAQFLCLCDCGNKKIICSKSLLKGATRSCGCYSLEVKTKHGKYGTRIYRTWQRMLDRCNNSNHAHFKHYGGRGIAVCTRWRKFENFYADMGIPLSPKHTLDRINNNGHYEPSNCQWSTWKTQNSNRGKYNHKITFNNETKTITEWAHSIGISTGALANRLRKKWPIGDALLLSRQPPGRKH